MAIEDEEPYDREAWTKVGSRARTRILVVPGSQFRHAQCQCRGNEISCAAMLEQARPTVVRRSLEHA